MPDPVIDKFQAHNGRQNDQGTIVEANMVDLLIPADALRRQPFRGQLINALAQLIELFVFTPYNQPIPVAPMLICADQAAPQ